MITKILLIILYSLVLYNFTFLNIGNIYNFNFKSLDFILFIVNIIISIFGLIYLRFFQIKKTVIKNNLAHTFKSIVFLYIFLVGGFFISQEFLIQNRDILTVTKLSGNLAFLFLSIGLLVSPILTFITNIKLRDSLTLFRKLLGILVFIIIIRHVIDFFISHYPYGEGFFDYWTYFYGILFESPVIWSGTIATVMIVLLGLTSNKLSVKKFGAKIWKTLHFLVFPVYFFSMLHIFYLGRIDWFYGSFTVLIVLARIIATIARRHRRRKAGKVTKYLCPPCGFIYDEKLGDPDGGLPPGTKFEDIPDDWVCPVCGVRKSDFVPYYETENTIFGGTLLRVTKSNLVTKDILHLVLKGKNKINCFPGQYVGLVMKDFDGEFTRSYSIVNNERDSLEFYIKLKDSGRAGKLLKKTNIGDYFKITGVYGEFILKESTNPKVFIGTGTGLAPLIFMINKNTFSKNSSLYFGVAKKEDLFGLDKINKKIEQNIYLSQEKVSGYNYGRINLEKKEFDEKTEFYICGNPNMVENNVKLLKKMGYDNIYSEKFN